MWLLAAVLVLATAAMVAVGKPSWWWAVDAAAALVSQGVILTSWTDAKGGTVANVLLVLVAVLGFAAHGPGEERKGGSAPVSQTVSEVPRQSVSRPAKVPQTSSCTCEVRTEPQPSGHSCPDPTATPKWWEHFR